MPEIPKGFYIKKNGKRVRRITLAQVQMEFQEKPFQKTPKDIETIKKLLVEYAKMNLPPNEQRKMIARVKIVKTKKDLEEAIELAEKYAEQHYKRTSGKKKQNKKTTPPEPLSKKEMKKLFTGGKSLLFKSFANNKKRRKFLYGDIKPPTTFDKFIVQKTEDTSVFEKAQIAILARETAYTGRHLERWAEEKIEGEVAEWYEQVDSPFTYRVIPITKSCQTIEEMLDQQLVHFKNDFRAGCKKIIDVAKQCNIDRTKCFGFVPIKPIRNFQSAAAEFWETIKAIHIKAIIEFDKLTKPASGDNSGGDIWHNNDYTTVKWYGTEYQFNKTQARCVMYLWENNSATEINIGKYIRSVAEPYRLKDTFRSKQGYHCAWGEMIVTSGKGCFKLNKSKS